MAWGHRIIRVVDIPEPFEVRLGFDRCSKRCANRVAYVVRMNYITGRGGRAGSKTTFLCEACAQRFAHQHRLPFDTIPTIPYVHPSRPRIATPWWDGLLDPYMLRAEEP